MAQVRGGACLARRIGVNGDGGRISGRVQAPNSIAPWDEIGVRAGARTGYVIPGRDGNGGWRFEEILLPSPSSPSAAKSRVLGENGILRFVTHSRAMHFLASAYESYGRGGSFLF